MKKAFASSHPNSQHAIGSVPVHKPKCTNSSAQSSTAPTTFRSDASQIPGHTPRHHKHTHTHTHHMHIPFHHLPPGTGICLSICGWINTVVDKHNLCICSVVSCFAFAFALHKGILLVGIAVVLLSLVSLHMPVVLISNAQATVSIYLSVCLSVCE